MKPMELGVRSLSDLQADAAGGSVPGADQRIDEIISYGILAEKVGLDIFGHGGRDAAARAGLEEVCVHSLRHSAATAMLEAGVNIKAVSDLVGHSSVSITGDIYGHTSVDSARAAVAKLSDAMGF